MAQVVLAKWAETRGGGGESPDRTADHGACRGTDASGGATMVIADGTEELLQDVVGPGQPRDVVAVEESRPVAGADLEEVRHRRLEGADARLLVPDLGEQRLQLLSDLVAGEIVLVLQEPGGLVNPAVGDPDSRPHRVRGGQPFGDERAELPQLGRQAPFPARRPREASIASSRSRSLSPEAVSGG